MFDAEEFSKKQEEAQKAHEEKQRKLKEAEDAKADLASKIAAQAEERRLLMERLASQSQVAYEWNRAAGKSNYADGSIEGQARGARS